LGSWDQPTQHLQITATNLELTLVGGPASLEHPSESLQHDLLAPEELVLRPGDLPGETARGERNRALQPTVKASGTGAALRDLAHAKWGPDGLDEALGDLASQPSAVTPFAGQEEQRPVPECARLCAGASACGVGLAEDWPAWVPNVFTGLRRGLYLRILGEQQPRR
jgi:hypothetical protein